MPALVAAAAVTAAGAVTGGAMASHAAGKAADAQTSAADRAAARQQQTARETERFLREQAENGFRNSEADRRGNYDQWAAKERRLASIAEALGYGGRQIPAYVPGADPGFTNPGAPPPTPPPGAPPARGSLPSRTQQPYAPSVNAALQPTPLPSGTLQMPGSPSGAPTAAAMPGPVSIDEALRRRQPPPPQGAQGRGYMYWPGMEMRPGVNY